jgi:hypothetical protein
MSIHYYTATVNRSSLVYLLSFTPKCLYQVPYTSCWHWSLLEKSTSVKCNYADTKHRSARSKYLLNDAVTNGWFREERKMLRERINIHIMRANEINRLATAECRTLTLTTRHEGMLHHFRFFSSLTCMCNLERRKSSTNLYS